MKLLTYTLILTMLFSSCSKEETSTTVDFNGGVPKVTSQATYDVSVVEDITYAQGISHESLNSDEYVPVSLLLDAFVPNNSEANRPVFLLVHGGGFVGGSKRQSQIVDLAHYFASRGWVVFSIDYRLKNDFGTVPPEWENYSQENLYPSLNGTFNALYPAHRDAKAALRWVVANADTYNIDLDYITVGGGSAGAIIATTLGISDPQDYTIEISPKVDPTLNTTNMEESYTVSSIVDFWGSAVGIEALSKVYGQERFNSNDPPLIIFHGTEDPTVRFEEGEKLRDAYISTGAPYAFYPLDGYRHEAWNATIEGKNLTQLTFDFLVDHQNLKVN